MDAKLIRKRARGVVPRSEDSVALARLQQREVDERTGRCGDRLAPQAGNLIADRVGLGHRESDAVHYFGRTAVREHGNSEFGIETFDIES
jgi:hypothetical protein